MEILEFWTINHMENREEWCEKIMVLVKKHNLGFLLNPGGGQFTNKEKGINIQVFANSEKEDYFKLKQGLIELGLEE